MSNLIGRTTLIVADGWTGADNSPKNDFVAEGPTTKSIVAAIENFYSPDWHTYILKSSQLSHNMMITSTP